MQEPKTDVLSMKIAGKKRKKVLGCISWHDLTQKFSRHDSCLIRESAMAIHFRHVYAGDEIGVVDREMSL